MDPFLIFFHFAAGVSLLLHQGTAVAGSMLIGGCVYAAVVGWRDRKRSTAQREEPED